MIREKISPRDGYQQKLEAVGLSFHSWDNYWKEDVCYKFTADQVDMIEAATEELHQMCLEAVDYTIKNNRLGELHIPALYHDEIKRSFNHRDFHLYGRFDFAYDGKDNLKMLEYNADTPTSLLESAVAQWYWMEDKFPNCDQFNSLHDKLVAHWASFHETETIHVASLKDNEEDWVCTMYLVDTIVQANRRAKYIAIEDIGYDNERTTFVDMEGEEINTLFKLYPWEWMMREDFGKHVIVSNTQFVEPIWKSVLSCKGILPILWELFPNHKNLLPAYFHPNGMKSYAKKPIFSREGANIGLYSGGSLISSDDGPYGKEGYIYQELYDLPCFDGKYPIIGSWVVGDSSAGMCVREDSKLITTNMSNFVPHYFE